MYTTQRSNTPQYFTPATGKASTIQSRAETTTPLDEDGRATDAAATPADYVRNLDEYFRAALEKGHAQSSQSPDQAVKSVATSRSATTTAPASPDLAALLAEVSKVAEHRADTKHALTQLPQPRRADDRSQLPAAGLFSAFLPPRPLTRSVQHHNPVASAPPAARVAGSRHGVPGPVQPNGSLALVTAQQQPPAVPSAQLGSPLSPGALAWQAAGKAWQSRAPGAETTTKQSHSRLETLLQEIEAQRSKSAASVTADSSRTGLQPATQQQRIVERVPEAAVDNVGYQRGTGDVAATSVWNWETERTPQESAQSAAETTAEVGQLTWTRPIWQPISIPCRFPGVCQELLTRIEAWEEADSKSAKDFAVQIDCLCTLRN